MDDFIYSEPTN